MRERCILSQEQAEAVESVRIRRFFASPLYEKMKEGEIRREFKFSVTMPVSDYDTRIQDTEEEILLQGVIDCLSETPEGFLIIDFKTD